LTAATFSFGLLGILVQQQFQKFCMKVCDISAELAAFLQTETAGTRSLLQQIVFQFARYSGYDAITHVSQVS
jgi:hypothetical protein